jgi:hypothetical protein
MTGYLEQETGYQQRASLLFQPKEETRDCILQKCKPE